MYSGPGHDAQYVVDLIPAAMIFVPSEKGHSHCELEYTPLDSCLKGANVLLKTLLQIDKTSEGAGLHPLLLMFYSFIYYPQ
jgi:N-carbamoyl-L-amino-acid hydrolase